MNRLALARAWYAVIGLAAAGITAGHVLGSMEGSRLDPPIVAIGVVIAVLAIAAVAWVRSPGGMQTVVVWLGIIAGLAPFAWGLTVAITGARDAIVLATIPSVIALGAAWTMIRARQAASRI